MFIGSKYRLLNKLVAILEGSKIPNADYPADVMENVFDILAWISLNDGYKKIMIKDYNDSEQTKKSRLDWFNMQSRH